MDEPTNMNEQDEALFEQNFIGNLIKGLGRLGEGVIKFVEGANELVQKIMPALEMIANVSLKFLVISELGDAQYVLWEPMPESFYEQAYGITNGEQLLNLVQKWHEENGFIEVDKTIKLLSMNEELVDNPVFEQAVEAYKRKDYDLAALGFTAMIDRLLAIYSENINSPSISKRVVEIKNKISEGDESIIDFAERCNMILFCSYFNAMEIFGATKKFDEDEPELNRHWIMHGRISFHGTCDKMRSFRDKYAEGKYTREEIREMFEAAMAVVEEYEKARGKRVDLSEAAGGK